MLRTGGGRSPGAGEGHHTMFTRRISFGPTSTLPYYFFVKGAATSTKEELSSVDYENVMCQAGSRRTGVCNVGTHLFVTN